MDETLYIRTDANSKLGIGHVMRCKTIADEWLKRGGNCIFLVADEESQTFVCNMGFECFCLHGKWNHLEIEIDPLRKLIQKYSVKILLIDSYYITSEYMKCLADFVKLIYLGGLHEEASPVHMLINYNIMADTVAYEKRYPANVIKLLGCRYFPLRPEFLRQEITIRDKVENVFISTGGTEIFHVALLLAQALLQYDNINLHVVLGAYNQDKKELQNLQKTFSGLFLYENVQNMAEIMTQCDLAVSAGGITLYELCACGIPTITYAFADNQLGAIRTFEEKKIMMSIGDIRVQKTRQWQEQICKMVAALSSDKNMRENLSDRMRQLIDGKGTERIVDNIEKWRYTI